MHSQSARPPTLIHGTPEQINEIRAYFEDILDDAGVENKKQTSVYHNRRFWKIIVLRRDFFPCS